MNYITILDLKEDSIHIHRDLTKAAKALNMTPNVLHNKLLKGGIYYTNGCFVGLSELIKSSRGGKRPGSFK